MWNLRRSLLLWDGIGPLWNSSVIPFNNIKKKDTKITPETDSVDLIERCTGAAYILDLQINVYRPNSPETTMMSDL